MVYSKNEQPGGICGFFLCHIFCGFFRLSLFSLGARNGDFRGSVIERELIEVAFRKEFGISLNPLVFCSVGVARKVLVS